MENSLDLTIDENLQALLNCKHCINSPHDTKEGHRIVGFIIAENKVGIHRAILALERLQELARAQLEQQVDMNEFFRNQQNMLATKIIIKEE